jgi:hypothetical protein
MARPPRIKLGVRQRAPAGVPNFRDHGLMVDRPLLRLVANLQRAHGYAWTSERGLREMIHQDTGHAPGVGTLPKALLRLEELGYIEARWIYRGSTMPDGGLAQRGGLRLRFAVNRGERRSIAARFPKVDRREGVDGRVTRAVPASFAAVRREILRGSAEHTPSAAERERAYAESLRRSSAAAATWAELQRGDGQGPDG